MNATEDYNNEIPPADWMIDGVIARGECTMISSAAKAGKSYLMTQLAITMATGGDWLGRFQCKKVPVLYLCGENEINDARRRFKRIFQKMGIVPTSDTCEKIGMYCVDGMIHSVQSIQQALINEIKANGYELVILDPLYCFYEGSELDEQVGKEFVASLKTICHETKTSLVCVHHHSKGASSKYASSPDDCASGTSMFQRAFSTILTLREIPGADQLTELPEGARAFVFNLKPRQGPISQINLFFKFPIWEADKEKILPDDAMRKAQTLGARGACGNNRKGDLIKSRLAERIEDAFAKDGKTDEDGRYVTLKDIMRSFASVGIEISTKALEGHVDRSMIYRRDEKRNQRSWVRKTATQGLMDTLQDTVDSGRMEVVHELGQMELPLTTMA